MDIPFQITNYTEPIIIRANDLPFTILQLIIPVVASAFIALFTIRYSNKSHQRNAMMDVFHMLNEGKNKETEDDMIKHFRNGNFDKYLKDYPEFYDDVRKVWRTYDQIGILISKRLIPKKEFYLLVGLKMVALYLCSHNEIQNRRITRPRSMTYFSNMSIDCFEFYEKRGVPITNPANGQPIERKQLGDRLKL